MYGTVARFRIKPGLEKQLDEVMHSYDTERIPGAIDEWIYRLGDDPRTYYMTVLFESKEAYVKNANSPEQDKRYRRFRDLLEADPEWHDGEIIYVYSQHAGQRRAAA